MRKAVTPSRPAWKAAGSAASHSQRPRPGAGQAAALTRASKSNSAAWLVPARGAVGGESASGRQPSGSAPRRWSRP